MTENKSKITAIISMIVMLISICFGCDDKTTPKQDISSNMPISQAENKEFSSEEVSAVEKIPEWVKTAPPKYLTITNGDKRFCIKSDASTYREENAFFSITVLNYWLAKEVCVEAEKINNIDQFKLPKEMFQDRTQW